MSWIWFQRTKSGAPWRGDLVLHQGAPITTVTVFYIHLYPFESIKVHLICDYASSSLIYFCLSATCIQILLNPSIHPFEPPKIHSKSMLYSDSSQVHWLPTSSSLPITLWLTFSKHPNLSADTIVDFPVCLIIPSNLDSICSHDHKSLLSWADVLEMSHMKRIILSEPGPIIVYPCKWLTPWGLVVAF